MEDNTYHHTINSGLGSNNDQNSHRNFYQRLSYRWEKEDHCNLYFNYKKKEKIFYVPSLYRIHVELINKLFTA